MEWKLRGRAKATRIGVALRSGMTRRSDLVDCIKHPLRLDGQGASEHTVAIAASERVGGGLILSYALIPRLIPSSRQSPPG